MTIEARLGYYADALSSVRARHRLGIFASSVIAGVILGGALPMAARSPSQASTETPSPPSAPSAPTTASIATALSSPIETVEVIVRRNDTLDAIFRRLELNVADLASLRSAPQVRKSLDRLRPGDVIKLTHLNGEIESLTRPVNETDTLAVMRLADGFDASIITNPLETTMVALEGTVRSSLFEAVNQAGGSDQLAIDLAEVFRYDIDFVNEVRAGDQFKVYYEQRHQDGTFVRDGSILAAEFVNRGRAYRAVRYVMPDGKAEYFTPEGQSLRKAFLRFPVEFARISSGFSSARRHPILNRVRAHKGIDFAAPVGTPVKAAGAGRVQFAGIRGGYGNVVVVAHSGGVTTLYGHLSRFAPGLSAGDRVQQGQLLGRVGMSGLATGPHLHYEYRINGVHRDPARATMPKAEPIPPQLRQDFLARASVLLAALDADSEEPLNLHASAGNR
jgi:murein DD-endopeptidase MepM/ murein hydrolase activator NlpD